uniref:Uncharacterized protein n=1 Tax=Hucho hucho TaxID=62062 RepID=A0A4W5PQM2_9TELE
MECVVRILQATGLPRHLGNFVFCQYHFWGQDEPVFIAPEMEPSPPSATSKEPLCTVLFDSSKVGLWRSHIEKGLETFKSRRGQQRSRSLHVV